MTLWVVTVFIVLLRVTVVGCCPFCRDPAFDFKYNPSTEAFSLVDGEQSDLSHFLHLFTLWNSHHISLMGDSIMKQYHDVFLCAACKLEGQVHNDSYAVYGINFTDTGNYGPMSSYAFPHELNANKALALLTKATASRHRVVIEKLGISFRLTHLRVFSFARERHFRDRTWLSSQHPFGVDANAIASEMEWQKNIENKAEGGRGGRGGRGGAAQVLWFMNIGHAAYIPLWHDIPVGPKEAIPVVTLLFSLHANLVFVEHPPQDFNAVGGGYPLHATEADRALQCVCDANMSLSLVKRINQYAVQQIERVNKRAPVVVRIFDTFASPNNHFCKAHWFAVRGRRYPDDCTHYMESAAVFSAAAKEFSLATAEIINRLTEIDLN